jgi:hypothetical protein
MPSAVHQTWRPHANTHGYLVSISQSESLARQVSGRPRIGITDHTKAATQPMNVQPKKKLMMKMGADWGWRRLAAMMNGKK